MVKIERLRVSGLRNLQAVDLTFPDGTIWLVGPNGAGKTSVLESVYVLSRGSSFRGRRHGPLTSRGAFCTRLEARLRDGDQCWERHWSSAERRQAQSIGRGFLVRLVGSAMHTLLEGDPTLRRRFVDWNVFHVEPQFGGLRQRFRRVAAQRNAWLKEGGRGRPVWDQDYAAVLTQVAEFRQRFVGALSAAFEQVAHDFPALSGVALEWRSGLAKGLDIGGWLSEHRAADVARGYTFLSPSRADFHLVKQGVPWAGSRGQNKLVGILLQVAAARVVFDALGRRAVWLVDDPGAELDLQIQGKVLPLLYRSADQLIVTSLSEPQGDVSSHCSVTVFHVEQGKVGAIARA